MTNQTTALVVDDKTRSQHSRLIEGEIELNTDAAWRNGKYTQFRVKTPCRISYIMHNYYKYQAQSYTKLTVIMCGICIAIPVLLGIIALLFKSIFFAILCGFIWVVIIVMPAAKIDGGLGIEKIPMLKYVPKIKYCKQLYELTSKLEGYKEIIGMTINKTNSWGDPKYTLVIDFVDFCGYKEQVKFDISDFQGREVYNDGSKEPFCYIDLTEKYYESCAKPRGAKFTA